MNWIEARVVFESDQPGLLAEAIAQVFHDQGLKGVVIDDPGILPGVDWCDQPAERPAKPAVSGYFPAGGQAETRCRNLEKGLAALASDLGFRQQIQYRTVAEQDWARAWKAHFKPVAVGRRLVVKPSWYDWQPEPHQLVVEIDPGMAFGTGTHPSTCLSMALLENHLTPGVSFLDVGTGSGILMVTAARLGAGLVWGTDNDPVAVKIARQNMLANKIDPNRFQVMETDLVAGIGRRFQTVAANILAGVIMELVPQLKTVVEPGGIFICAGLIADQAGQVRQALEDQGFAILDSLGKEDWVALASRYAQP